MPTTNNQMSSQDIQTDITFIQKPLVSKEKSFNDNNLVMKLIPPISNPREEKPKFICNRCEFSVELKETRPSLAFIIKEVFPSVEVPKKMLKEFKEVVHDNLVERLPPLRDVLLHINLIP